MLPQLMLHRVFPFHECKLRVASFPQILMSRLAAYAGSAKPLKLNGIKKMRLAERKAEKSEKKLEKNSA